MYREPLITEASIEAIHIECKKCHTLQDVEHYYFSRKGNLLHGGWCKTCISIHNSENSSKIREKNLAQYLRKYDDFYWKPIRGYENFYLVSIKGEVLNISRGLSPKIMKIFYRSDGYGQITFYDKKIYYIHRLVASTFLDNPLDLPCINHKNGSKSDNAVANLEWCSASYNNTHMYRELGYSGSLKGVKGSKHPYAHAVVLLEDGVEIDRWGSLVEASEATGIRSPYISKSCSKRTPIGNKQFMYLEKYVAKSTLNDTAGTCGKRGILENQR